MFDNYVVFFKYFVLDYCSLWERSIPVLLSLVNFSPSMPATKIPLVYCQSYEAVFNQRKQEATQTRP